MTISSRGASFGQRDHQRLGVEIRHRPDADCASLRRLRTLLHRPTSPVDACKRSIIRVGHAAARSVGDGYIASAEHGQNGAETEGIITSQSPSFLHIRISRP